MAAVATPEEFVEAFGDLPATKNKSSAPLGVFRFAEFVYSQIKANTLARLDPYFDGICATIPTCENNFDPTNHSVVGQKLYVVDWERFYPNLELLCPCCGAALKHTRSTFSNNRTLFPIFGIDGPPSWAMVMVYKCQGSDDCGRTFRGNSGELLCNLPPHIASQYPVEPKYARPEGRCHINKFATDVFEELLVTHGNGNLCTTLIINSMNQAYVTRLMCHISYCKMHKVKPQEYVKKDGQFITSHPPQAHMIRSLYMAGAESPWNRSRLSDKERHKREIQGVKCKATFAQDHTFSVVANYRGISGTAALWDVATETGEIATAVLVPSTKTRDYACAAQQWIKRTDTTPQAMYSDTWPAKNAFWEKLIGKDIGRLGLFHFLQRIIRTLRTNHFLFNKAINDLLACIYSYHGPDYDNLLRHLKQGSFGKKYSENDIATMQKTKQFRQNWAKFLRKVMHGDELAKTNLHQWVVCYKCSASEGQLPAEGKRDPRTGQTLFTETTHSAVENCIRNVVHLQDLLPLEQMYREVKPPRNAKHNCSTWVSFRGESKLESFHDNLAHFGNCGMDRKLCDILNLAGTARYNFTIRNRIHKVKFPDANLPVQWQDVVSFYNHSELATINKMAADAHADYIPFAWVEPLVEDTKEVFFSEYLTRRLEVAENYPDHTDDQCPCNLCKQPSLPIVEQQQITWTPPPIPVPPRISNTPVQRQRSVPPSPPPPQPNWQPPAQPTWQALQPAWQAPPQPTWQLPPGPTTQWIPYLQQYGWPAVTMACLPPPAPPETWQILRYCCKAKYDYAIKPGSFGRPPHDEPTCTRSRNTTTKNNKRRNNR
jgi:hypothetical protein